MEQAYSYQVQQEHIKQMLQSDKYYRQMALEINGPGEIPLLEDAEVDEVLLVDKLYARAYNHFQICIIISAIYSIGKACAAPFILVLTDPIKSPEQAWLIILMPISILQLLYYCKVWKVAKNHQVFLQVANQSQHAAYFLTNQVSQSARATSIHDNIVNLRNLAAQDIADKQVKILSLEIKYDVLKTDGATMVISRVLFVIYTAIHIWGYLIFILDDSQPSLADYFIVLVFFLGTYQYLEIYLGICGFIVALPFLMLYLLIKYIRDRRRTRKIVRMLRGKKYNPETHKGQNICHICMDDYKQQDTLIVLACNEMHHFHQACLTEWIKVANTCPLCRVDIEIQ